MNRSTALLVGTSGMRERDVQEVPLFEELMTRSLALQPGRKLQSDQTTYTVPAPSTAALGSPGLRKPPASVCSLSGPILTLRPQLDPPLVDMKAAISPELKLKIGTTTLPFGWTTGCPPIPNSSSAVFFAVPQVWPPSVEVLIYTRSPLAGLSHST